MVDGVTFQLFMDARSARKGSPLAFGVGNAILV